MGNPLSTLWKYCRCYARCMKSWIGSSLHGLTMFLINAGHKFIASMTMWLSTPTASYRLSDCSQGPWSHRRDPSVFWKNQGGLRSNVTNGYLSFYPSGNRKSRFLRLKTLSTNAGHLPLTSISWAYEGVIIRVGSWSLSKNSRFGEASVCLVSVPSSPHMIGKPEHHHCHSYVPSCTTRVGIAICKWLFQSVHDTQAISIFDYILPLMASTAAMPVNF